MVANASDTYDKECDTCKRESKILNKCDACDKHKCENCDNDYMICEECEDLHCSSCDTFIWVKACYTCKHCYEYNQQQIMISVNKRDYQGILNCLENYIYEDIYVNYILLECIPMLNFYIIEFILTYYTIRQDVIIDCLYYTLAIEKNINTYQIIKILADKANDHILYSLLRASNLMNNLDLNEYLEYKLTGY
jgi:hypothetical protein